MHRFQGNSALHGQPAGHRAVNAAGKQEQPFAGNTHRQAAGPRNPLSINLDGFITDFHIQHGLRIMNIHLQAGDTAQNVRANLGANLL